MQQIGARDGNSRMNEPGADDDLEGRPILDRPAFAHFAATYRRELKVHCYRMMGSLHEADDLVQDTLLRAWRARAGFDGRGSLRGWLYSIATNSCLNAIKARGRSRRIIVAPDRHPRSGRQALALLQGFCGSSLTPTRNCPIHRTVLQARRRATSSERRSGSPLLLPSRNCLRDSQSTHAVWS
ncbi:sigma-70 family RNA polymerase sigma factor [Devosia sp.]|uniref:sigma-70 family RNA polymerase sigma factor n=1 Tax=Devosia sp. TaxID=1871048 RepID=UPI003BAB6C9D